MDDWRWTRIFRLYDLWQRANSKQQRHVLNIISFIIILCLDNLLLLILNGVRSAQRHSITIPHERWHSAVSFGYVFHSFHSFTSMSAEAAQFWCAIVANRQQLILLPNSNKITNVSEKLNFVHISFWQNANTILLDSFHVRARRDCQIRIRRSNTSTCIQLVFWQSVLGSGFIYFIVCVVFARPYLDASFTKDVAGRPLAATDAHDDSMIDYIISVFVLRHWSENYNSIWSHCCDSDHIVVHVWRCTSAARFRWSWVSHEGNI